MMDIKILKPVVLMFSLVMPTPYSHCMLVEHKRIPVAETCSKNSWSKQVPDCLPFCCASVSFLLREPTTPEAIGFPKQFRTQGGYTLNLFRCCSKLFSEGELPAIC